MKRTIACLNKASNLSNACKGKTTLLVYERSEKPAERKHDCVPRPQISIVPTKKIRICTGAELKKMCRPTPCECPPQLSKFGSFLNCLYRTVLFSIKSAILGSLVYWTWEAGIWGDSVDVERFYSTVCYLFSEKCTKPDKVLSKSCQKELEIIALTIPPSVDDPCIVPPVNNAKLQYKIKQSWNHAVTGVFEGVTQFPDNVSRYYQKIMGNEKKCIKVKSK
ncbi:hypothetical protein RN001_000769 [Aquatica leii]|uniref:MICOS complex subunit MIC13 n=1 Tax=Aquatica leii TaxID=1421715 RepID=A0AAN7PFQ9_9COLE|nr:hypothetical protein RN001_000769 [Aquatica leii]